MSDPRFLVKPLPFEGPVRLDPAEAKHARQVLRLKPGDQVVLFDGEGGEAAGLIERCDKRQVDVRIEKRTDTDRELARPLSIFIALPKGDRQRTLVEGLVQLGVQRLVPLVCQRGVAQPTRTALVRLQRTVVEASKQCGRNRCMEIAEPISLGELIVEPPPAAQLQLFAHPYGTARPPAELSLAAGVGGRIAVGPEGGFSEHEVAAFRAAGWQQVSLGSRTLRIEIAALAIAAWWSLASADCSTGAQQ